MAPSGKVIGFDLTALLQLAQHQGYDLYALSELLPYAESGMLLGLRELYHGDDA